MGGFEILMGLFLFGKVCALLKLRSGHFIVMSVVFIHLSKWFQYFPLSGESMTILHEQLKSFPSSKNILVT